MENLTVLNSTMYNTTRKAVSAFSGEPVTIIGEQTVEYEGKAIEQYLYNIDNYTAENGKPFAALKANLLVEEEPTPTIDSIVGKSFKHEFELEKALKEIVTVKRLQPVMDGFWLETDKKTLIKLFTTTTIGPLTVTGVR